MKKYIVAEFAGTREEAVAFCEAHVGFFVANVTLPDGEKMEFPLIGLDVGDAADDKCFAALERFNDLGWDRHSVWRVEELEVEDEKGV